MERKDEGDVQITQSKMRLNSFSRKCKREKFYLAQESNVSGVPGFKGKNANYVDGTLMLKAAASERERELRLQRLNVYQQFPEILDVHSQDLSIMKDQRKINEWRRRLMTLRNSGANYCFMTKSSEAKTKISQMGN